MSDIGPELPASPAPDDDAAGTGPVGGEPASDEPVVEHDEPARNRTARFAWGAVVVILAGVIALFVYALTNSPVTLQTVRRTVTAPGVVTQISTVPPKVFDTVGVSAPGTPLVPPTVLAGQPALLAGGRPEVLYVGAEYCPFCAAERWPLIVALSRFGHFTSLFNMQSAANSVFPGIQSFTFVHAVYRSPYLTFTGVEQYSDALTTTGSFTRIATLTPRQSQLVASYRGAATPAATAGSYPFIDIANRMVTSTSGFSPAVLVHQSQAAIAAGLTQSDTPVTQAVVAAANFLTAGMCAATGQRPGPVCTSRGVRTAAVALGLP